MKAHNILDEEFEFGLLQEHEDVVAVYNLLPFKRWTRLRLYTACEHIHEEAPSEEGQIEQSASCRF